MGKFIKTKNIQKVKDDIISNKLPSASGLQESENNDDDTGTSTSKEELPSPAKTTSSMGLSDTFKNFKFNFSSANDKNISEDTKPTNKPDTDVLMGFKFNFGPHKSSSSSVENPQEFNINHSDKSNNDSSTKADEANDKAENLEPVSNKKESLSNFKFSFGAHQTTSKKECETSISNNKTLGLFSSFKFSATTSSQDCSEKEDSSPSLLNHIQCLDTSSKNDFNPLKLSEYVFSPTKLCNRFAQQDITKLSMNNDFADFQIKRETSKTNGDTQIESYLLLGHREDADCSEADLTQALHLPYYEPTESDPYFVISGLDQLELIEDTETGELTLISADPINYEMESVSEDSVSEIDHNEIIDYDEYEEKGSKQTHDSPGCPDIEDLVERIEEENDIKKDKKSKDQATINRSKDVRKKNESNKKDGQSLVSASKGSNSPSLEYYEEKRQELLRELEINIDDYKKKLDKKRQNEHLSPIQDKSSQLRHQLLKNMEKELEKFGKNKAKVKEQERVYEQSNKKKKEKKDKEKHREDKERKDKDKKKHREDKERKVKDKKDKKKDNDKSKKKEGPKNRKEKLEKEDNKKKSEYHSERKRRKSPESPKIESKIRKSENSLSSRIAAIEAQYKYKESLMRPVKLQLATVYNIKAKPSISDAKTEIQLGGDLLGYATKLSEEETQNAEKAPKLKLNKGIASAMVRNALFDVKTEENELRSAIEPLTSILYKPGTLEDAMLKAKKLINESHSIRSFSSVYQKKYCDKRKELIDEVEKKIAKYTKKIKGDKFEKSNKKGKDNEVAGKNSTKKGQEKSCEQQEHSKETLEKELTSNEPEKEEREDSEIKDQAEKQKDVSAKEPSKDIQEDDTKKTEQTEESLEKEPLIKEKELTKEEIEEAIQKYREKLIKKVEEQLIKYEEKLKKRWEKEKLDRIHEEERRKKRRLEDGEIASSSSRSPRRRHGYDDNSRDRSIRAGIESSSDRDRRKSDRYLDRRMSPSYARNRSRSGERRYRSRSRSTESYKERQREYQSRLKSAFFSPRNKHSEISYSYGRREYRQRSPPREEIARFFCEVCNIRCHGPKQYKEHLDSERHKKKETAVTQAIYNKEVYKCEACNLTCQGIISYKMHLDGQHHRKTIVLLKRMGKPIPETPTIVATSANTYKIEESSFKIEESETSKKVIAGINQGNFIPGGSLSIDEKEEDVKMKDVKTEVPEGQNEPQTSSHPYEANSNIVGEEFVETITNPTGIFLHYQCSLCNCQFTDINARDVHIKGRRHRTNYMMKVNPNMRVDNQPNVMRQMQRIRMPPQPYYPPLVQTMPPWVRPWDINRRRFVSLQQTPHAPPRPAFHPYNVMPRCNMRFPYPFMDPMLERQLMANYEAHGGEEEEMEETGEDGSQYEEQQEDGPNESQSQEEEA